MKLFVILLTGVLACNLFAYRPFEYSYTGSRVTGQGGAVGAMVDAPENILYNPAALAGFTWKELLYEVDSSLLLDSFRWNYRIIFDAINLAGVIYPFNEANLVTAFSFIRMFNGTDQRTARANFGSVKYSVRQLGFSAAYRPSTRFSFGASGGLAIASEHDIVNDDYDFSYSGSAQIGMLAIPWLYSGEREVISFKTGHKKKVPIERSYIVGLSAMSPLKFNWSSYKGEIEELLPFTIRLANSYVIPFRSGRRESVDLVDKEGNYLGSVPKMVIRTNTLRLFLDFEYQGWIGAYMKSDGIEETLQAKPFEFGTSFMPHFGIELYDGGLTGNKIAGGIYRLGFSPRTSVSEYGEFYTRYNLTLGMTAFAGKHFRISGSIVDSLAVEGILAAVEAISGKNIRDGYAIMEEFHFGIEMDMSIFTDDDDPDYEPGINKKRQKRRKPLPKGRLPVTIIKRTSHGTAAPPPPGFYKNREPIGEENKNEEEETVLEEVVEESTETVLEEEVEESTETEEIEE